MIRRAVSIRQEAGQDRPEDGQLHGLLARAWARALQLDEAVSAAQQAQSPDVLMDSKIGIASELAKLGRKTEAQGILNSILPDLRARFPLRKVPSEPGGSAQQASMWTKIAEAAQALALASNFEDSLEIIGRIGDGTVRQEALAGVVEKLAGDGQTDRALALMDSELSRAVDVRVRVKAENCPASCAGGFSRSSPESVGDFRAERTRRRPGGGSLPGTGTWPRAGGVD